MMKTMKHVLAFLLAALMLCGLAAPACAEGGHYHTNWGSKVPVVLVGGDGVPLADQDGNEICRFVDISNTFKSSDGDRHQARQAVFPEWGLSVLCR